MSIWEEIGAPGVGWHSVVLCECLSEVGTTEFVAVQRIRVAEEVSSWAVRVESYAAVWRV